MAKNNDCSRETVYISVILPDRAKLGLNVSLHACSQSVGFMSAATDAPESYRRKISSIHF